MLISLLLKIHHKVADVMIKSEMGLTPEQVADLDPSALAKRLAAIEARFETAGVHYVVDSR